MTHKAPTLWYMNSDVLQGFYCSDVIVAATGRDDAIQNALSAYDLWVKESLDDYGFHRLIRDCYPTDEDFVQQSKEKRAEFHEELKARFKQQTRRSMIKVLS